MSFSYFNDLKLNSLSIILPCAGEGSRLNLGYPKELYEIRKSLKLIDFSLQHVLKSISIGNLNINLSVIITSKKEEVYNYVQRSLPTLEVNKIYFNNKYKEWPGSVYSAKDTFSDFNIVLLPDTYLSFSGESLFESLIEKMKKYDVVFGYKKTKSKELIKNLGAMYVKNNKIIKFKDKPLKNLDQYNSYWGCYGFKKEVGKELYKYLYNSVSKTDQDAETHPTIKMGGVPVNSFYDLGTWKSIKKFIELKKSTI